MRDMPNLDEFLSSYPDALKKAFNLGAMTTGTGFLNAELYTLVLPILFLVFGISRGSRLVAGEEEAGAASDGPDVRRGAAADVVRNRRGP